MGKDADHLPVGLLNIELDPVDGLKCLDRPNDRVAIAFLQVNFDLFQINAFVVGRNG